MPYPNEHSCRLKDPGKYDRFNRVNCAQKHDGKCIDVIYGIKDKKSEVQSLRYKKDIWSEAAARAHCEDKEGVFEPAQEEKNVEQDLEIRNIPMQEMEARKTEDGKMIIEGYAIVYNQEAEIWGDIEIILPGAASEALKVEDQYYLWQHDTRSPLARKKIGTLTAEEDEAGVFIRAEVIDTQFGRDCHMNVSTGLVDKQSFAFRVDEEGEDWKTKKEDGKTIWIRYIKKFSIIPEFSAVTFPAYEDTTLQARCKQLALRNRPNPGTPGKAGATVLEVLKDARANIEMQRKSIEKRSQHEKD